MKSALIATLMHVAPFGQGFGIRIRADRNTSGVWLGEGWVTAEAAKEIGAIDTENNRGWMWPSEFAAEIALDLIRRESMAHGYQKDWPAAAKCIGSTSQGTIWISTENRYAVRWHDGSITEVEGLEAAIGLAAMGKPNVA